MGTDFRLVMEETKASLVEQGLPVTELEAAIQGYLAQVPIMPGKAPDFSEPVAKLKALSEQYEGTPNANEFRRMAEYLTGLQEYFEKQWNR